MSCLASHHEKPSARLVMVLAMAILLPVVANPAAASGLPRQDFPEPVLSSLRTALGAYEEARAELAADRLEGLPGSASRLAAALRQALDSQGKLAQPIPDTAEEAALAADSLARAEDLATARVAFGEVSRGLLILAGSAPSLSAGLHVFTCPMAEEFGKWIQPTETLQNPYMGPSMLACGGPTDWSVPTTAGAQVAPAAAAEPPRAAADGPKFEPGIPGLEMEDVRDHRFLWREIEELQIWERADRISVAEYRSKVVEKTAHFLQLDAAATDELASVTTAAVASVRDAFLQRRGVHGQARGQETSGLEANFSTDLAAATTRVSSLLGDEPRHQLFAPGCKKWLLRLAFGPSEAKEAREAKEAQQAKGS